MSIPSQLHLFSRTIPVSQNVCRQRTRRKSYPLNCQELAFLPLLQVQKWNCKSLMTTSPVWQTEKKCNWQTVINWKFGIQRSNKALPIPMRSTSKIKNSANVVSKASLLFFLLFYLFGTWFFADTQSLSSSPGRVDWEKLFFAIRCVFFKELHTLENTEILSSNWMKCYNRKNSDFETATSKFFLNCLRGCFLLVLSFRKNVRKWNVIRKSQSIYFIILYYWKKILL